jgi:general secretion pathway protein G
MMELIFVIFIIAILAVVAIPRLAAMRDNAALAKDVSRMAICIKDANSYTLGTGMTFDINDSESCRIVECYDINSSNHQLTVSIDNDHPPGFCAEIGELGSHLVGTYKLKGHHVKF